MPLAPGEEGRGGVLARAATVRGLQAAQHHGPRSHAAALEGGDNLTIPATSLTRILNFYVYFLSYFMSNFIALYRIVSSARSVLLNRSST